MKVITLFAACLLLGLASTAPTSDDEKVVVTEEFYPKQYVVATAQHDIVNILVPLNDINFGDDFTEDDLTDIDMTLFFTEADKNAEGKYVYKGLYVLKDKKVTMLLEQGTAAAADSDNSKTAYFAAKDGLYKYNAAENKAEKYGSVEDSLISIAKVNNTDLLYVLTEDHVLYKVTGEGTKKEKVAEVTNAQQIVLDNADNLYFYTPTKEVYVVNVHGIKKIEGLPVSTSVTLMNPPFVVDEGIPMIMDKLSYVAYPNGTSEFGDFELNAKPTAYSMEATIYQYYAYNKKIYGYNLLDLILTGLVEELKDYLQDKKENLQAISSNLKSKRA